MREAAVVRAKVVLSLEMGKLLVLPWPVEDTVLRMLLGINGFVNKGPGEFQCVRLLLLLFLLSCFSHVRLCATPRRQPTRLHRRPWDSPGKNTGVGCHFLLQWDSLRAVLFPYSPGILNTHPLLSSLHIYSFHSHHDKFSHFITFLNLRTPNSQLIKGRGNVSVPAVGDL